MRQRAPTQGFPSSRRSTPTNCSDFQTAGSFCHHPAHAARKLLIETRRRSGKAGTPLAIFLCIMVVMDGSMFQESMFVAVKLLLAACVVALVAAVLLTRVACARLVAQGDTWIDPVAQRQRRRRSRTGIHPLQTGGRNVHAQPH